MNCTSHIQFNTKEIRAEYINITIRYILTQHPYTFFITVSLWCALSCSLALSLSLGQMSRRYAQIARKFPTPALSVVASWHFALLSRRILPCVKDRSLERAPRGRSCKAKQSKAKESKVHGERVGSFEPRVGVKLGCLRLHRVTSSRSVWLQHVGENTRVNILSPKPSETRYFLGRYSNSDLERRSVSQGNFIVSSRNRDNDACNYIVWENIRAILNN